MHTLWRVDAQHAEFDGSFTQLCTTEDLARSREYALRPWGWLVDVYQIELPREPLNVRLLCEAHWPVIDNEALLDLAELKTIGRANVDLNAKFSLAEVHAS